MQVNKRLMRKAGLLELLARFLAPEESACHPQTLAALLNLVIDSDSAKRALASHGVMLSRLVQMAGNKQDALTQARAVLLLGELARVEKLQQRIAEVVEDMGLV